VQPQTQSGAELMAAHLADLMREQKYPPYQ
jgi:hypothetical protein